MNPVHLFFGLYPKGGKVIDEALTFRDRYAISWQIYATGTEFHNSGTAGGRWLDVRP
jgi:hypothetical protein